MKANFSTECWAEHVQQNQASPGKARSHRTGTYPDAPPITILQIEQHSHDVTHSFSSLGSLGSEVKRLQLVRGTSTWASLGAKLPEPVVSLTSAKTLRRWLWSYIFCAVQPLDDWGKWLQHDFLGWLNSTSIFISYLLYLFFSIPLTITCSKKKNNSRKQVVFMGTFTNGLKIGVPGGRLQICREGDCRKFLSHVEHMTFSGDYAKIRKQEVLYITEPWERLRFKKLFFIFFRDIQWNHFLLECVRKIRIWAWIYKNLYNDIHIYIYIQVFVCITFYLCMYTWICICTHIYLTIHYCRVYQQLFHMFWDVLLLALTALRCINSFPFHVGKS